MTTTPAPTSPPFFDDFDDACGRAGPATVAVRLADGGDGATAMLAGGGGALLGGGGAGAGFSTTGGAGGVASLFSLSPVTGGTYAICECGSRISPSGSGAAGGFAGFGDSEPA
jgi:hypothetical protein